MAFIPLAFAGGMAKRGSEILKEEREEALTNAEDTIKIFTELGLPKATEPVSYTHLRAHETDSYLVCRLLLEKKK